MLHTQRFLSSYVVSTLIGQDAKGTRREGNSTRHWVLNFIVVLCGLFLILSYEAAMT